MSSSAPGCFVVLPSWLKWGYRNSWMVYFMENPIKIDMFFFSITEETPNGFVQTWDAPQTLSNISLRPNVLASPEFLYANIATLRITQNGMVHARGTNPGHCIYRIYVCINIYIYMYIDIYIYILYIHILYTHLTWVLVGSNLPFQSPPLQVCGRRCVPGCI